jgi:hypothetical protein
MDQQLGEIEADLLDDTLTPEQASVDTRIQPPVDTPENRPPRLAS